MAGLMSRNKGKQGEREIAMLMRAIMVRACMDAGMSREQAEDCGKKIKRNTLQSDGGGYDLTCPGLAVEVKRQETLKIKEWWQQAVEQAKDGEVPVLLWRQNRGQWRCMMYVWIPVDGKIGGSRPAEIAFDDFKWWLYWRLRAWAQGKAEGLA